MSGHMTIGEFATATWLSTKALRLYDEKGLLTPDATDPHTGYRRYSPAQVETARLITLLRRLDMPLDQVREVVDGPRGAGGADRPVSGARGGAARAATVLGPVPRRRPR